MKGIERKQFLCVSLGPAHTNSLPRDPVPRVYMYRSPIQSSAVVSYRHRIVGPCSSTPTCLHRQTRLPRSQLGSTRAAGIAQAARSGQSTGPSRVRCGRARRPVRRQRGRQRWRSSCFAGRGSADRVAVPSCDRRRRSRAASGWGMLGGRGECGRPL